MSELGTEVKVSRRREWQHTNYLLSDRQENTVVLPSVTSVLQVWPAPQLDAWKLRQIARHWRDSTPLPDGDHQGVGGLNRLVQAGQDWLPANRGKDCHRAVEDAFRGRSPGAGWHPNLDWVDIAIEIKKTIRSQVDVTLTEAVVVDREKGYAGTADLLGRDKSGLPVVLDVKTGSGVWDAHWAQVHAYSAASEILVGRRLREMPTGCRAGLVHAPLSGYQDDAPPKLTGPVLIHWIDETDLRAYAARQWLLALDVWKHYQAGQK